MREEVVALANFRRSGSIVVETKTFDETPDGLKLARPIEDFVVTVAQGDKSASIRIMKAAMKPIIDLITQATAPRIVVLFEMRLGDEGRTRLERWPEGLVLWSGGEIRWKSWEAV